MHDQLVFTAPIPEGVVVRNGDVLRTEIEYTVENDGRMTLHSVSVIGIDRARSDDEVVNGDSIQLRYSEAGRPDRVVLEDMITESHTFDEAVILESEEGEFGADYGIGGMFLEHK